MEELLSQMIKGITGCDNFTIERQENEGGNLLLLKIPDEYIGLVIGKEGKTIKAIRALLKVRATLEKTRIDLNVEPLKK